MREGCSIFNRRDAMRLTAGAAITTAGATSFSSAMAASSPARLKRIYDNALVIDALSFAREWDDVEYEAVKQSGYAGIVTSLDRRNLQTAIDELVTMPAKPVQSVVML